MKYKSKFSSPEYGYLKPITEDSTFESNEYGGMVAFIPFTDQRFFEPVKVRKFQVEVSEEHMDRFDSLINDGFEPWTVTEIAENRYLEALKANREVAPQVIEIMSDYENIVVTHSMFLISLNEHGRNNRLSVVKDVKALLYKRFPTITGLKNAKDIVDSWWKL